MDKNNRPLSPKNFMKIEFPSLDTNANLACTALTAFAEQMNPTTTELDELKYIVNEAVENAIIHAYPDSIGMISIKARNLNGNILKIEVNDHGLGIQNVEEARKPCFTTGGSECSGMGFTVMESFASTMQVVSTPGKGTTVTIRYHIGQK